MSVISETHKLFKLQHIFFLPLVVNSESENSQNIKLYLFTAAVSCSDISTLKRDDFFLVLIISLPLAPP